MKKFYARTANTGLTDVIFCIMTQRNEPVLFHFLKGIKKEIPDLFKQYEKKELTYEKKDVIGLYTAGQLIKKYDLTNFPE
jgi:hypothetical protein